MQWACTEPGSKAAVLRVLRFGRSSARKLALTGPGHTLWRDRLFLWPKRFLEPTGYAVSRARPRLMTPLSTPPGAHCGRIAHPILALRMLYSARTRANP